MKLGKGQAAWIFFEALHRLGRIAMLLLFLGLGMFGLLAFRLSRGPLEIPRLASWLATLVTGEGIKVHISQAELAWAGYHRGGAVPLVLRLSGIEVLTESGYGLAAIPAATLTAPAADLFGGHVPFTVNGAGATFPEVAAPVSWHADLWPGAGFTVSHGTVYVGLGAGRIGKGENSVALDNASFTLSVAPDGEVTVNGGVAQLHPSGQSAPRLTFSLRAARHGLWLGQLQARLDAVAAPDLTAYWPPALMAITRGWVTRNITAGTARNAAFTFDIAAQPDLSRLRLINARGRFTGDDLTLSWLNGLPPITHLNGVFDLPGLDTAVITATSGEDGVALTGGTFTITDMTAKDQTGYLQVDLAGSIQKVLQVFASSPLHLLDHVPGEVKTATGQARATVHASIPFRHDLHMADVGLDIQATLSDVRIETPIPGAALTGGNAALSTDGHKLHATGHADFAGGPADLTVDQDFSGAEMFHLTLKGLAGPQFWQGVGLNDPSLNTALQGGTPFTFTLAGPQGGTQQAELDADLTSATFALPLFGWRKSAGDPGSLSARFTMEKGQFGSFQSAAIQAPGLAVKGHSQGRLFLLDEGDIGRTQVSGSLTAPAGRGEAWDLHLSGPTLDLRRETLKPKPGAHTSAAGPAWRAQITLRRLYLAAPPAPPLENVSLTAAGRGSLVDTASGNATGLRLSAAPAQLPRHDLTVQGDDAGTLLRVLGAYNAMEGGKLNAQASYGGGPAKGVVKLDDFRLVKAPGFIKVLQGVTLYGVAEAVSGPGLEINHAEVPFTLDANLLGLKNAVAHSASIGFTASGTIDLNTGICDLDTTIVPAYALNALPGKIPLIGRLFSAEKGGGLFAMRAQVKGPLDDPTVQANPLSAVTPGFLRGIFGLGGSPQPH